MDVEIIFAEFGENRENAGGANLKGRLEPSLSSFRKYFPEARFTVYTDQDWTLDGVHVEQVKSPFGNHPRKGWRDNDAFQVYGLLHSEAEIAIAVDSDLVIVNRNVRSLLALTEKFGLCMPVNGRHLVWKDAKSTCDGGPVHDGSLGMGMCHATALWSFCTQSSLHRTLLEAYLRQIHCDAEGNRGARGPLSLWRAEWDTGVAPYTLPVQWCITSSNMGPVKYKNETEPVILHVGHPAIHEHYRELL